MEGPQYNSKKFNQPGGIDISQSIVVAYDWNRKGGYYNFEGQNVDFGMNKPMSNRLIYYENTTNGRSK